MLDLTTRRIPGVSIFAEVKTQSPFGWESEKSWDELFRVAVSCADVLSIHTDPRWGGSFELLARARALTNVPILAKGIHANDDEVSRTFSLGADLCLVVGRIPQVFDERIIVEPAGLDDLQDIPSEYRVFWNTRDLATGGLSVESFDDARRLRSGWLGQASNIRTVNDILPGANAALVGTHLEDFAKSLC